MRGDKKAICDLAPGPAPRPSLPHLDYRPCTFPERLRAIRITQVLLVLAQFLSVLPF